ncbi:putative conjugative transfer protein TraA [Orientia tsutsugamushi str. Ikeda]|uniref:Putative conjugative transfer protein TraA n=1 Tax=Orientia tsutsugamushi (strain Ikeda) TaxID=334380 RepID=B3CU55_ORITI|nr:AAA family ATPase [Orientia tsutsugamushi]BAG40902.1 putative conjugative transfer protein TraA [Orientia tsutsugamushi str. Ikeda]
MAIQFTRIEFLTRSKGGDSCRKAAYNARTIVKNENTGIKYNFSRKKDNVYHTVLIPDYVKQEFKNIQTLMNEVERTAKNQKNSQLLKDIVIALPDDKELNLEHRIELTHQIVDAMEWVQNGLGVQIDIHKPQTGDKNWHTHILLTMRRFREDGTGLGDIAVDLNPKIITVNGKKVVIKDSKMIHEIAKEETNAYFAELGLPYRVDETSEVPGKHIGPRRIRNLINEVLNENELRKEAHLKIINDADVITDSITHYKSIFTKQDVEKAVKDIPDPTAREQLVQQVLSSNRILELYHDDGESSKYFTTIEVRNEETRIIRIANKINDQVYYNDIYNLKSDIEGLANVSEEQKQALRHILLSTSGVRVLRGRAGTGKSYVLIKAHKLATNRGQKVIGLAPTHKAVSELRSKGYTEVYTVKGFLYNRKKNFMQGSLIVVDEAGMVGTKAYAELFRVVRNNNCQLILAGDEKQLASIERGGMFEMLSNIFGSHVLVNIRRQSKNWSREAATKFAESNILSCITLLRQNKCVKFDNTLQDSMSKLIYNWSLSKFKLHEKLVITVRNKDVDILNSSIRSLLKANGTLQGKEYRRSIAERKESYMAGDRIVFQKSYKDLQIQNSEFATLTSVSKNKFIAKTDTRKEVSFDPSEIQFKHGYASTVYKAQGASIKDVYVLHNGISNISSSYVAMTRHIENLQLYCNKEATGSINSLINQLSRPNEKSASITLKTAHDLEKERTKTTVFSKIENWFKSIINDINDRSHVNEEYYHFTAKPEQEAKVEKVQLKDISTPLFMHIKEQRQYDYDVTILSAEGKTISSFQKAGIDSRMVYSSNVNNLKYYQPFQGEKILIAANNDKHNKEYASTINEAAKALKSKGAITSIVVPSEGEDFNEMLKNKGAIAVKELMIPEIMKLINTQNVKTESEQVVKTDIAPKIGVRR